ncbi:MAG: hypothetical protein ACO1SV_02230 [Fimbriimonas sp.]
MNIQTPVTPGVEPEVGRWLAAVADHQEPAAAEARQIAIRILRRIQLLRNASPGSREHVQAEMDVLRRRLAVLAAGGGR